MPRRRPTPNDDINKWLVRPVIFIVSIYVVGVIIQQFTGIPFAFTAIFAGVGGLLYFIDYYRKHRPK